MGKLSDPLPVSALLFAGAVSVVLVKLATTPPIVSVVVVSVVYVLDEV